MRDCIGILNIRSRAFIFHYAHFICDCLFVEVINEIYKYKSILRTKEITQTLGNLSNIYEDVMQKKNIEIPLTDFIKQPCKKFVLPTRHEYIHNIKYVRKFRSYIFNRYKIRPFIYINEYPEFLLIKRGERVPLINDPELNKDLIDSKINVSMHPITTGSERREIKNIDILEEKLREKYSNKFNAVFLENMPFEEQVKLFNNAKVIILAHGAAMSNMFFCKKGTTIIEVTCNRKWPFFDKISSILELKHIKVVDNNVDTIIDNLPAQ